MNPHPALEVFVNWLVNQSLQAGVLVLLVLFVQGVFRRQLTARWRFALWWLVLLLLLMPFRPQSAFSLFNYCRAYVVLDGPRYPVPVASMPSVAPAATSLPLEVPPQPGFDPGAAPSEKSAEVQADPASAQAPKTGPPTVKLAEIVTGVPGARTIDFDDLLLPGLAALWLLGALVLGVYVLQQALRFQRHLARSVRPVEDAALALLEDCRRELGVRRRVELLETDAVKSPALFGLFHLRLLLPTGLTARFSREQLRFIFLHELAHVKRGDLWLNWLVTALQIMHWFNPLLWLGFARLRADRELACDELALLHAGENAGKSYGQTIIKLLEGFNRPAAIPGLVGIVEDARQMERRIRMIARFKKPSRWTALASVLVIVLGIVGLTNARTEAPAAKKPEAKPTSLGLSGPQAALAGRVTDAHGHAIENAYVFIHAATPRTGPAVLAPSAYPDCEKSTRTGKDGRFQFQALNSDLLFQVLVAAKGQLPELVTDVDPAKGEAKVSLKEAVRGNSDSSCVVVGHVVDSAGRPVRGAVIRPLSVKSGSVVWPGILRGLEPLAVSDEAGLFSIYRPTPFDSLKLRVAARGFADNTFGEVESGRIIRELRLTGGALITGRVVRKGSPVAGVSVGLCGVRSARESTVGDYAIATDKDGRSVFENVPPRSACLVFGRMNPAGPNGVTAFCRVNSGADGSKADVGDLEAVHVSRIEGRIALSDGRRAPPGAEVALHRDEVRDPQHAIADVEGRFAFAGIPAEPVMIDVRVPGFRLSTQNASFDPVSRRRLIGTAHTNKTDLLILVEPGQESGSDFDALEQIFLRRMSIRGAEEITAKSGYVELRGMVTDGATQQPLERFAVIPGYGERHGVGTCWRRRQAIVSSNGTFVVHLDPSPKLRPAVRIEADGYFPKESDFISATNASLTFLMEPNEALRGVERRADGAISGVVRLPDGGLAGGAEVALSPNGSMPALGPGHFAKRTTTTRTDARGTFFFSPLTDAHTLVAAHAQGFAEVPVEQIIREREVRLERWGRIEGTLRVGRNAAAGETVLLTTASQGPHAFSFDIHAFTAQTDKEGHFAMAYVPPGDHRLMHLPKQPVRMIPNSVGVPVSIRSGAVTSVSLGGTGRPVIGRLTADKPGQKIDWGKQVWEAVLTADRPADPVLPKNLAKAELIKFWKSAEGRAHERNCRDYRLDISNDGAFRIEDVPAGPYVLHVIITELSFRYGYAQSIGALHQEVDVPELVGGRSDEALDLGALTLRIREPAKAAVK